jgi:hypothetical protein
MNPCPAGLEIHPDLAGYRVFPVDAVRNHNSKAFLFFGVPTAGLRRRGWKQKTILHDSREAT